MASRQSPGWLRFGAYARDLRVERDLTQRQVADELNRVGQRATPYRQAHVSAYELGRRLSFEVVRDYILAFGLDADSVVDVVLCGTTDGVYAGNTPSS